MSFSKTLYLVRKFYFISYTLFNPPPPPHSSVISTISLLECPSGPKVITIGDDMSLYALWKTIMDAIGGCRILLHLFYCQPIYVGDGCVESVRSSNVMMMWGKYFSSFYNLVAKV